MTVRIFERLFGHKKPRQPDPPSPQSPKPKPISLDPHGQPDSNLNLHRRLARNTSEVVGVLRGLIADGKISHERMVFLGKWLLTNKEFAPEFPFSELFVKVDIALKAPHIGEQNRREIFTLIERITGTDNSEGFENTPTTYPLTDPPPEIVFAGSEFVLTGTFEFGARKECEAEIVARGGTCGQYVTRRTRCLVIGKLSSRDWTNTSWGNKIRDAASRAANPGKYPISIVSEKQWNAALERTSATAANPVDIALHVDNERISFACPLCAKKINKTKAWLKSHVELECSGCGNSFDLKVC